MVSTCHYTSQNTLNTNKDNYKAPGHRRNENSKTNSKISRRNKNNKSQTTSVIKWTNGAKDMKFSAVYDQN